MKRLNRRTTFIVAAVAVVGYSLAAAAAQPMFRSQNPTITTNGPVAAGQTKQPGVADTPALLDNSIPVNAFTTVKSSVVKPGWKKIYGMPQNSMNAPISMVSCDIAADPKDTPSLRGLVNIKEVKAYRHYRILNRTNWTFSQVIMQTLIVELTKYAPHDDNIFENAGGTLINLKPHELRDFEGRDTLDLDIHSSGMFCKIDEAVRSDGQDIQFPADYPEMDINRTE